MRRVVLEAFSVQMKFLLSKIPGCSYLFSISYKMQNVALKNITVFFTYVKVFIASFAAINFNSFIWCYRFPCFVHIPPVDIPFSNTAPLSILDEPSELILLSGWSSRIGLPFTMFQFTSVIVFEVRNVRPAVFCLLWHSLLV